MVGALSICGGGFALFCSQYFDSHNVHQYGSQPFGYGLFHRMALFAVGDQTLLEPFRGSFQDKKMVDYSHAIFDGSRFGRSCLFSPG